MTDTDEGDSLQDWKLGHWPVQFALRRLQSELGVHLDGGCSLPISYPGSTSISLSSLTFEGQYIYDPVP